VIVYDALFLSLAEDAGTVVITADGKLRKALEGTPYARLAHPLADVGSLVPSAG
jgi:predicted nucleic acid-binding protein